MKTYFFYFNFTILLLTVNLSYGQQKQSNKLFYVIDSTFHDANDVAMEKYKLILLYDGKYFELFDVYNYESEFNYVLRYRIKDGNDIFVFENYNTLTGDTELFYIIPQLKTVLHINIKEYEIPLYNSYNPICKFIQVISFNNGNCGKIINKKISIYKNIDEIKNCKVELNKSYIIKESFKIQ